MKTKRMLQLIVSIIMLASCIYQRADMQTDMSVGFPKFDPSTSPNVLFDAGHGNFHEIYTTYEPFATLLKNDGVLIREHQGLFTENSLNNIDLLIIANATGSEQKGGYMTGAFSDSEIHVLMDWIRKGGSLLLIADHDPFGSAASDLAKVLGVGMDNVWTADPLRLNQEIGRNTWLEYDRENGGLGQHLILQAHSPEFAINRVITFTGQSLSFDSTWTSILQLSNSARNYYERSDAKVASEDTSTYFSVPGQSQLIARKYGEGRIAIAGEAAMFTAQEVRVLWKTMNAGFNYGGYDNKKLVLNIIHWLLFEID